MSSACSHLNYTMMKAGGVTMVGHVQCFDCKTKGRIEKIAWDSEKCDHLVLCRVLHLDGIMRLKCVKCNKYNNMQLNDNSFYAGSDA